MSLCETERVQIEEFGETVQKLARLHSILDVITLENIKKT